LVLGCVAEKLCVLLDWTGLDVDADGVGEDGEEGGKRRLFILLLVVGRRA
jgi:hypothetical protein